MKNKDIFRALLILLFSYAVLSKLLDAGTFRQQMLNQVLGPRLNLLLVYLVPASEAAAAGLLYFRRTSLAGFWLSSVLMALFTGYIALVLLHAWPRVPCSCGGILGKMSWGPHLVFNLLFLAVALAGLYLERRRR